MHDCWVDCAKLGLDNSIAEVCQRGFKIPQGGLRFTVGTITNEDMGPAQRNHKFILCKLGVEVSQVQTATEAARHRATADTSDQSQRYRHQFNILDPGAALPCYLVEFEFDPEGEIRKKVLSIQCVVKCCNIVGLVITV